MKKPSSVIVRTMPILEIVTFLPAAKSVLSEYGLHCFHCAGSEFETLEEGCRGHGFSDEEIDELVDDLNDMLRTMPTRPKTLTVTEPAAKAVRQVAESDPEAKTSMAADGVIRLAVIVDSAGGFCMEFRKEPEPGEQPFFSPKDPAVLILASELTLQRIGGATIDFREGRFKLDLPEDAQNSPCDCTDGSCGCVRKTAQNPK